MPATTPSPPPGTSWCWHCGYEIPSADLARENFRCPECGQLPGAVWCWSCGYELLPVDLARASFKCPECGQTNIPNDSNFGPIEPVAAMGWPATAATLLWPGALMGAGATLLRWIHLADLGVLLSSIAIVAAIGWPFLMCRHVLPRRRRPRADLLTGAMLPLLAAAANLLLVFGLPHYLAK